MAELILGAYLYTYLRKYQAALLYSRFTKEAIMGGQAVKREIL